MQPFLTAFNIYSGSTSMLLPVVNDVEEKWFSDAVNSDLIITHVQLLML